MSFYLNTKVYRCEPLNAKNYDIYKRNQAGTEIIFNFYKGNLKLKNELAFKFQFISKNSVVKLFSLLIYISNYIFIFVVIK